MTVTDTDPTRIEPLCDEPRFAEILESMVAYHAPRVFAVVQEYGDRVDARIAAWGLAFEDRAEAFGVSGGSYQGFDTPGHVAQLFRIGTHVRSRLVWVNPDAAPPPEGSEEE